MNGARAVKQAISGTVLHDMHPTRSLFTYMAGSRADDADRKKWVHGSSCAGLNGNLLFTLDNPQSRGFFVLLCSSQLASQTTAVCMNLWLQGVWEGQAQWMHNNECAVRICSSKMRKIVWTPQRYPLVFHIPWLSWLEIHCHCA